MKRRAYCVGVLRPLSIDGFVILVIGTGSSFSEVLIPPLPTLYTLPPNLFSLLARHDFLPLFVISAKLWNRPRLGSSAISFFCLQPWNRLRAWVLGFFCFPFRSFGTTSGLGSLACFLLVPSYLFVHLACPLNPLRLPPLLRASRGSILSRQTFPPPTHPCQGYQD